jgi:hypothetical protein
VPLIVTLTIEKEAAEKRLGLIMTGTSTPRICSFHPGSLAEKEGMLIGDEILTINGTKPAGHAEAGQKILSSATLVIEIRRACAGDPAATAGQRVATLEGTVEARARQAEELDRELERDRSSMDRRLSEAREARQHAEEARHAAEAAASQAAARAEQTRARYAPFPQARPSPAAWAAATTPLIGGAARSTAVTGAVAGAVAGASRPTAVAAATPSGLAPPPRPPPIASEPGYPVTPAESQSDDGSYSYSESESERRAATAS